jgi:hypothetical protein
LIEASIEPGRLKKNFDFSKTESVDWSFCALSAFSRIGKKTVSALFEVSVVGLGGSALRACSCAAAARAGIEAGARAGRRTAKRLLDGERAIVRVWDDERLLHLLIDAWSKAGRKGAGQLRAPV